MWFQGQVAPYLCASVVWHLAARRPIDSKINRLSVHSGQLKPLRAVSACAAPPWTLCIFPNYSARSNRCLIMKECVTVDQSAIY